MLLHLLEWGLVLRKRNIQNVIRSKYLVTRKEDESCLFKQRRPLKQLNVFTLTNNMYLVCHRHCCTAHDSGENVRSVGCLFQAEHYCLNLKLKQENLFRSMCALVRSNFRVICHVMRLTVTIFFLVML